MLLFRIPFLQKKQKGKDRETLDINLRCLDIFFIYFTYTCTYLPAFLFIFIHFYNFTQNSMKRFHCIMMKMETVVASFESLKRYRNLLFKLIIASVALL